MDNKRYALDDVNQLVKKIANGKIDKNKAIKAYNNLLNKAEQIAKLRSAPPRQKILEISDHGEKSASRRQGLKILTPNQILSRLPIFLAQLNAWNNSEKLKNEIRQLLYYFRRSKKLTKNVYNHLNNVF